MNKVIITTIFSLLALVSCQSADNVDQLIAIDESICGSSLVISQTNRVIYENLNEKLNNIISQYKALVWRPKAQEVKKLVIGISGFIDSVKVELEREVVIIDGNKKKTYSKAGREPVTQLFQEQGKAAELFRKLADFKHAVISVIKPAEFSDNPMMQQELIAYCKKLESLILVDVPNTYEKNNSISANPANPIIEYFSNTTLLQSIIVLDKLKNDVLRAENTILNYYMRWMPIGRDIYYEQVSAIVTQNSTYLKPGQLLQIYAGIGAFSVAAKPTFIINGTKIPVDSDGVVTYELKAGKKPGKYSVPVKIEFIKPDGSPITLTKNINYTIDR
jgi:hypothetical protein